jgi:LuxR family maltose regulon positive regulatory protein
LAVPRLRPAPGAGNPRAPTARAACPIAGRLFLSSHTVKTEIKAIYRKLGVSSHNDAVQRATAIGLLGT